MKRSAWEEKWRPGVRTLEKFDCDLYLEWYGASLVQGEGTGDREGKAERERAEELGGEEGRAPGSRKSGEMNRSVSHSTFSRPHGMSPFPKGLCRHQ